VKQERSTVCQDARTSRYGTSKRNLDGLIQLRNLVGIASAHQSLQSLAWNGEDVVQVGHASDGQSLAATEQYFRRQLPNRAGNQRDHECA